MDNQPILVTGGDGFIGSNLIAYRLGYIDAEQLQTTATSMKNRHLLAAIAERACGLTTAEKLTRFWSWIDLP